MDNRTIDVVSDSKEHLLFALKIINKKAIGYKIDEKYGMILYWTEHEGITNLPYEMKSEQLTDFVWPWIQNQILPKHMWDDVDEKNGFRAFTEEWGHINGQWQAFIAIQPIGAWYGK